MSSLIFASGNAEKFAIAQATCKPLGMTLIQKHLGVDEIQGEDIEHIVEDKARKAFSRFSEPVVVSDDSWNIPGLNGFPGPYMKSMNHWLTPEDFLNLTHHLRDRRIILIRLLAYCDGEQVRLFRDEVVGRLLPESRGSHGVAIDKIVSLPGDNSLSIAEIHDQGITADRRSLAPCWQEFAAWYKREAAVQ